MVTLSAHVSDQESADPIASRCRCGLSANDAILLGRRPLATVRNHAETGRPKAIRPTLALTNLGADPRLIVIDAFPGAKTLERATVPHQAELAVAVRAVVLHSLLPNRVGTGRSQVSRASFVWRWGSSASTAPSTRVCSPPPARRRTAL